VRSADCFEIGPAFCRKIDEILVHGAAHPVAGTIDALDPKKESRFQHRTDQRLFDHRRWPIALSNHQLAASPCVGSQL
jgi:hypothetical protein